jgi:hypothetical protein
MRPERLAHLAMSWHMMEKGTPLAVLVWEGDPRKEDYWAIQWPKGWTLHEVPVKMLGERLEWWFAEHKADGFFGFIADDIVLRTRRGLGKLESLAEQWYLSYPSDCVHRHQLCTHFCVGGELARTVGGMIVPGFKHNWLDVAWRQIGLSTGSLRYAADVIFEHQHWLVGKAEKDATYAELAEEDYTNPQTDAGKADRELFHSLQENGVMEGLCLQIVRKRQQQFEHPVLWQEMDQALAEAS